MKILFTFLFVLVMLIVGALFTGLSLKNAYNYFSSNDWQKTSATIDTVSYETGFNRGAAIGGKSNKGSSGGLVKVYEVKAKYSYEFNGAKFTSNRINLTRSRSSQEAKQKRIYQQLLAHKNKNKPFPVYVNPNYPDQAVIFRDFSWAMNIFKLIMGSLGLLIAIGVIWSKLRGE